MNSLFGNWFRQLDVALESESLLANLYHHNATAGSVREFLVKALLQRFLPAVVTIESGKVIDDKGGMSKQIDIILFDSRVPCLRSLAGLGLFPIEGVLATIEVKTSLASSDAVVESLENCLSLSALTATRDAHFHDAIHRKVQEVIDREGLPPLEAYIMVAHCAFPPHYVFAINDGLSASGLCDVIDKWFHRSKSFIETVPAIPRMILAGHRVAIANDGISKITMAQTVQAEAVENFGPGVRVLMGIWPQVTHRWSFLATHLLLSVSHRLGIVHDYLQARYAIDKYLPSPECFENERLHEAEVDHVLWNGQFPEFRDPTVT